MMTLPKPRVLLVGLFRLMAVLACNCALGSIIFDQPGEDSSNLTGALEADQGMAPKTPQAPSTPNKGHDLPTLHQLEGLAPAGSGAGAPQSPSHGGGNGPTNPALGTISPYLPEPGLQVAAPSERRPILPTGPPFELLRPPRRSA